MVILVDEHDRETGRAEKLDAHQRGVLHRAFSVMVWDRRGRLLLQRRSIGKYHSGGRWTNACCGHPRPGELVAEAALRRLQEEMGFQCPLNLLGTFQYRAHLDRGLIEHELVHIFRGQFDGAIVANPDECDGFTWAMPDEIMRDVQSYPERFSAWFQKYCSAAWPVAPGVA